MQALLALTLAAALVSARPKPQGQATDEKETLLDGCTVDMLPCVAVHWFPDLINWGNADPGDVISYLNKPGGTCIGQGAETQCKNEVHMTNLPTMVVNANSGPVESHFDMWTIDSKFPNTKIRDLLIDVLKTAVSKTTNRTTEHWETQTFESGAIPGLTDNNTPSGDFPQNYAPSRVSVNYQAKDSQTLYYIDLQIKQGDPEPDFCKLLISLAGGISAGISGFLGPVATLAGAFGVVGTVADSCPNEDGTPPSGS